MSRQEIGNYLGLTVETVSRIFSRLQKEELIMIDRKLIKIIDSNALHDMCTGNRESSQSDHSAA